MRINVNSNLNDAQATISRRRRSYKSWRFPNPQLNKESALLLAPYRRGGQAPHQFGERLQVVKEKPILVISKAFRYGRVETHPAGRRASCPQKLDGLCRAFKKHSPITIGLVVYHDPANRACACLTQELEP